MKRPYASVILPTLERAAILPFALASVQAQTETDLEILLVLDGATAACREVACAAARADERISVLDLAKGPGDGSASVDHAVRKATAPRIFYIDDDDLWLPQHVARLGPLLDAHDVVDSRVCSVDRHGALHAGCSRGSAPPIRALLAAARLKMIYDTHIAHRADAYGRISTWQQGRTGQGVWDFLAGLAEDPSCRWISHDAVTALSFHGAARKDMSAESRAAELALWSARLGDMQTRLESASPLFHLFRLLIAAPPIDGDPRGYFEAHGCYDGIRDHRLAGALFDLCGKTPPAADVAVELAIALSEPVESGYLFENIALACFEAYGQAAHEHILWRAALSAGNNRAARIAGYSAALTRRDDRLALHLARHAAALGPDPVGALDRWSEKLVNL